MRLIKVEFNDGKKVTLYVAEFGMGAGVKAGSQMAEIGSGGGSVLDQLASLHGGVKEITEG
jgi:hypothetical protein